MRGKNANGDGSIYLDARGRYRATYVDPATGKRRTATGATKAQARDHRDAKLAELATTGTLGAGATVADVARHWLAHKAPAKARPPTLHAYGKDVARTSTASAQRRSPTSTPPPSNRSSRRCVPPATASGLFATPGPGCARLPTVRSAPAT